MKTQRSMGRVRSLAPLVLAGPALLMGVANCATTVDVTAPAGHRGGAGNTAGSESSGLATGKGGLESPATSGRTAVGQGGNPALGGGVGTGGGGGTAPCSSGQALCGSVCTSLQTDPVNCGTCGSACTGGQTCQNGRCSGGTGGTGAGGAATGGRATGGAPTGGRVTGGAATGGRATGGAPRGGAPAGGNTTGGAGGECQGNC
jgi:large repetitive protein